MHTSGGGTFAFTTQVGASRAAGLTRRAFTTGQSAITTIWERAAVGILFGAGGRGARWALDGHAVVVAAVIGIGPGVTLFTIAFSGRSVVNAVLRGLAGVRFFGVCVEAGGEEPRC